MRLDMCAVGVKQKDICEYYGMSKLTACNIVRRRRMNPNESNYENHGRNPKLTKDLFNHCCRTLNPIDSSLEILLWQNKICSY